MELLELERRLFLVGVDAFEFEADVGEPLAETIVEVASDPTTLVGSGERTKHRDYPSL